MNERFTEKLNDAKIVHDTVVLADFIQIWCDGHHMDRPRRLVETDAAQLDIYGRKRPKLCEECEAHLAYAEKRRAYCPQDPKPFCANCETHCYKSEERAWQQEMMRYSGPKSWRKGHAIDGIKHVLESRKFKKQAEARSKEAAAAAGSASNHQEETR